jgi:hypothetical protein
VGFCELSTFRTALVPEFQAEIVPSSLSKMKWAAVPGPFTRKSVATLLLTMPVGADTKPAGLPFGPGMVTTSDCGFPMPL